jgi:ribosomal protein S4
VARGAAEPHADPVHSIPVRAQIDIPVQEQLIVEYYSKK